MPGVDLVTAIARFEYAVPAGCATCGGRGKASMTDVMVLLDDQAIAIEAKYTEPKYESVGDWLGKGERKSGNREAVLKHWCHLISRFTGKHIDFAALDGLVYQTVHRTASACAAAPLGGATHVMYLVFTRGTEGNDYAADLADAARMLDPTAKIRFTLVEVPTSEGPDYREVERQLAAAADEDRVELLGDALLSGRKIYSFEDPKRTSIR